MHATQCNEQAADICARLTCSPLPSLRPHCWGRPHSHPASSHPPAVHVLRVATEMGRRQGTPPEKAPTQLRTANARSTHKHMAQEPRRKDGGSISRLQQALPVRAKAGGGEWLAVVGYKQCLDSSACQQLAVAVHIRLHHLVKLWRQHKLQVEGNRGHTCWMEQH